jgi:hypothetical protein
MILLSISKICIITSLILWVVLASASIIPVDGSSEIILYIVLELLLLLLLPTFEAKAEGLPPH